MSDKGNTLNAGDFDCGDGVPALTIVSGSSVQANGLNSTTIKDASPKISIRMFALGASILTQILIGIIVALGGNAIVGVVAAITVLTCSLILVIAEASNPA